MATEINDLLKVGSESLQAYVKNFKEDGFSFGRLWDFIQETVKIVENISEVINKEVDTLKLKGESKQDLALRLITENIDIPFLPKFIQRIVLKFLIDKTVESFNKSGVFKKK